MRGSRQQRGYTTLHDGWRTNVLEEDPLCVGYPDQDQAHPTTAPPPATVADHIVPLKRWRADPVGAALELARLLLAKGIDVSQVALDAWSQANGQGLCRTCHARKTAAGL